MVRATMASFCITRCSADVIVTRWRSAPHRDTVSITSLHCVEFLTSDATNRFASPVNHKHNNHYSSPTATTYRHKCVVVFNPLTPTVAIRGQLPSILCQTSFAILDIQTASQCPDVKNYKWRLNPIWHKMLYSCTHMATVGVKQLTMTFMRRQLVHPRTSLMKLSVYKHLAFSTNHWTDELKTTKNNYS